MNYRDFSSEDFAADAHFQKWDKNPDLDTILFWEKWLAQNLDKRSDLEEAKKLLATFRIQENEYSAEFIEEIWQNIESKIEAQENVRPLYTTNKSLFFRVSKIAASFLVLIMAAAFLYKLYVPTLLTNATATAEIKTILLPDSSLVTLNGNSKIHYRKSWNKNTSREVWLEGEGFFQVRKKPAAMASVPGVKFIVHVNLMDVEVLGTQFNVNTRRGKSQVVLSSGKVKLNSNTSFGPKSITMQPGDLVERIADRGQFLKKTVDPSLYSSWKSQQFVFKSTPVSEITAVLEDTYGWEIDIKDQQIGQMTFTSIVPVKKPDILLQLLAESFQVKIQKTGNKLVISK